MPPTRPASSPRAEDAAAPAALACRVTLADGQVVERELAPERHRAIQLGVLHSQTAGLVELTPGTRGGDGTLAIDRRGHAEHYLPGGAGGHPAWLANLLAHAARIVAGACARDRDATREEVFVGAAPRTRPRGSKDAVGATRFLWIDIDHPDRLNALWTFLSERPCHLLVETGGSGGVHAYWKLERPLEPTRRRGDGTREEPIERAHERLIHAIGTDLEGRPDVADPRCANRSRVLRLAGTVNHKRGAWARVIAADLALAPYALDELLDGLPEPRAATRPRARTDGPSPDPYKRIAPAEYFERLAGIQVPARGLVRCPVPGHEDTHPSCSVGRSSEDGWCCLAGETRIITSRGVEQLGDLAGTTRRILTTGGRWVDAPISSFGVQPLWRIEVDRSGRRKEIFATGEHRWFIQTQAKHRPRRELTTRELAERHRLVAVFPNRTPKVCKLNVSPVGVARGFTFGDGHRCRQGSRASFYGTRDAALLPYFPRANVYVHSPAGSLVVGDLPGFFKDLPDIEELPGYLYGWLAGYFAADGDVSDTTIAINCANGEVLERVRAICTRLGIGTFGIARYERRGIHGLVSGIFRLRLMGADLTPSFFVLPRHRARFEGLAPAYERRNWIVTRVEPTARTEEVFCATVPGTHAFALEDNILTGNCHAASCGARGAIYDLASVLAGGPWGPALRGEHFARARQAVVAAFADVATNRVKPPDDRPHGDDAGRATDAPAPVGERLWAVRVEDHIDPRIAGHSGGRYHSPPQPRADALTLIAMLLGGPVDGDATTAWSRPVAGGRRTVTLERAT